MADSQWAYIPDTTLARQVSSAAGHNLFGGGGVTFQISCILDIYIMVHNSSKEMILWLGSLGTVLKASALGELRTTDLHRSPQASGPPVSFLAVVYISVFTVNHSNACPNSVRAGVRLELVTAGELWCNTITDVQ